MKRLVPKPASLTSNALLQLFSLRSGIALLEVQELFLAGKHLNRYIGYLASVVRNDKKLEMMSTTKL